MRTYAGAKHSIEVPDDWQTSLDYLKHVTQAIVDYAGRKDRDGLCPS
ncbi:hypothetical protein NE652_10565 [Bifidobacterium pseudocatenulatum]|nr:hypothetical protein [Bifidobacterium pseudocatenulatum]